MWYIPPCALPSRCATGASQVYQDASSLGTINVVLNHYFLAFNGYEVGIVC